MQLSCYKKKHQCTKENKWQHIPSDNSEIFDMMNLLEDRLQHANGDVVLATIKVFQHLTLSMADVHQQVYERPPYVKKLELEMLTAAANENNTSNASSA